MFSFIFKVTINLKRKLNTSLVGIETGGEDNKYSSQPLEQNPIDIKILNH
jgi:hypothetical protein